MNVGKFLKENRIKRKLTQKQVSDRLGYESSQFISNIERGLNKVPFDSIGKVARAYGIKPQRLADRILVFEYENLEKKLIKYYK